MVGAFDKYNSVMLQTSRILVRVADHGARIAIALSALLVLSGCGQTGPLYLPTEPAAANRATLPQSLWPTMPARQKAAPAETAPAATPAPATQTNPNSAKP